MKKRWRVLLILVAVVCFAISLSYPLKYSMQKKNAEAGMERLAELRNEGLAKRGERGEEVEKTETAEEAGKESAEESGLQAESEQPEGTAPSDLEDGAESAEAPAEAVEASAPEGVQSEAAEPSEPSGSEEAQSQASQAEEEEQQSEEGVEAAQVQLSQPGAAQTQEQPGEQGAAQTQEQPGEPEGEQGAAQTQELAEATAEAAPTPVTTPMSKPTPTPEPTATPTPAPTVNRFERSGAVPYDQKVKRTLDVNKILPQFQEIYAENQDFAGWITIPNTDIDYPVVQAEDSDYYLHHDFFGEENANGQIILDTKCDPYTPSYNLVISGHNMRSGMMFGNLKEYVSENYWKDHKLVYFDTLMDERKYVVFAAFYSADYDVDEAGFRYNADIQYSVDAKNWLREVEENELYDTGIDAEFGDEFLTLTTCNKARRKDGRFVVVCRKLREGEDIE